MTSRQSIAPAEGMKHQVSVANYPSSHRARLERLMKAGHEAGDEAIVKRIMASDFVLHCPDGSSKTRDESAETYAAMRNALSSFTITCDLVVAEGDMIACRTSMDGRFTRPFTMMEDKKIEAHGRPVHFETVSIYRFDPHGVLVEEWAQSDNMTLFKQLGMTI
ncbi:ester cyclase [Actinoplanes sp. NPDC049265]|uniref:ester cyclase n=1 Tax=Actinoplanes sp. NPDC049265 TaxID=3363902 RepID=UPI0037161F8B